MQYPFNSVDFKNMIDKEKFRENFRYYDKAIVLQVIDIFLAEYPDRLKEIQASIENLDFSGIDNHAHSFKGVANYMSPELGELARQIEFKGKESDGEGLDEMFETLKWHTMLLADQLHDMRKEYE